MSQTDVEVQSTDQNRMLLLAPILLNMVFLLGFFVYMVLKGMPHGYPTGHDNFFWGGVHGQFAPINAVISLFDGRNDVYQTPNNGAAYIISYAIGVVTIPFTIKSFFVKPKPKKTQ